MNVNLAEKFVDDQIPMKIRRLFPPKLKTAYAAAGAIIKDNPTLQIPSALGLRGRVVSAAVDFAVKGLIDSQEWAGVEYRWEFFAKPTGQYLEVVLPHSTLSISQVSYWNEQPRDVVYRANARLGNHQIELPGFETEENDADDVPGGRISFLLVHGHGEIEFAHIGIPHKYHSRGYIYQTPNLMRLLYEVAPPDVPPPESEVDIDELMSLKEDIERAQRDNGGI